MFRRHHFNWVLFGIDMAAIFLLIAVVFAVVWGIPRLVRGPAMSSAPASAGDAGNGLILAYRENIEKLSAAVAAFSGTPDELFARVENGLFGVRVPQEMRQAHLEAVLIVGKLQGVAAEETFDSLKAKLMIIIAELAQK